MGVRLQMMVTGGRKGLSENHGSGLGMIWLTLGAGGLHQLR